MRMPGLSVCARVCGCVGCPSMRPVCVPILRCPFCGARECVHECTIARFLRRGLGLCVPLVTSYKCCSKMLGLSIFLGFPLCGACAFVLTLCGGFCLRVLRSFGGNGEHFGARSLLEHLYPPVSRWAP